MFWIKVKNGYLIYCAKTTKFCPLCRSHALLHQISMGEKICVDCCIRIEWKLEKGQKPLFCGVKR